MNEDDETIETLVTEAKADKAKWFRERAISYRKSASDNRDLAATMVKRASGLDDRATLFEAAADALELETTGNW